MERKVTPMMVTAERHNDGVVVQFTDGKCVFYSAVTLYSMIREAELQDEKVTAW